MKDDKKNFDYTRRQIKRTIEGIVKAEHIVMRSKFIAQAFPVETIDEVNNILLEVNKTYSDATHNCFAYVIGLDRNIYKYSDDGEPTGTAGKPIFQTIHNFNLTDILVIVTRYFGGVKLGASGLVRAYSNATKLVLEKAHIIEKPNERCLTLETSFNDYKRLKPFVQNQMNLIEEIFTDFVKIVVKIPVGSEQFFVEKLNSLTSGRIKIKFGDV